MNYQQTLDYLFSQLPMFHRIGAAAYKANLDNTHKICQLLGHPEKKFKSIHIAGTNGKGSVSNLIAAVLQSAGYKTGLYTSPHLSDFRERIRINGKKIPKARVTEFVKLNKCRFQEIHPSFFEYTFGMAVQYFANEKIEIAVMETGMGGRLDSTNIIDSILSVVTNIGWDHTRFLGDTLSKIATEKAGIFRKDVPVIIGETQPEVMPVFENAAKNAGTRLNFADQNYSLHIIERKAGISSYILLDVFKDGKPFLSNLKCALTGNYQLKNIVTTLQVIDSLQNLGFEIKQEYFYKGFAGVDKITGFKGRWQVLQKNPLVICDTGHNVDGFKEVISQLKTLSNKRLHIVVGFVKDKEIDKMIDMLPTEATYYFCKADIPRGLDQEELKLMCRNAGIIGESYASVKQALSEAIHHAGKDDLIFVGGSTFVVAEVV